jgi:release factor glutamine methyltransferase
MRSSPHLSRMVDGTQKKNSAPQTFYYHDLEITVQPQVYDPAEDSFLLLETLSVHPGNRALELGTGCGLIAIECAHRGCTVVCTDINPFAVRLARRNRKRNRHLLTGSLEVRYGDLFSVLHKNERFDVVLFNPPYLPTLKREKVDHWFDVATDGGRDGLQVTRRFIHGVRHHLRDNGCAYFIFSSLSDRPRLETYLKNQGFSFEICARRLFEGEELDVYRIVPVD